MATTYHYSCRCGHSRTVDADDFDTPHTRVAHLISGGWGLDGLAAICPCCIAHLQGQHDHQAHEVNQSARLIADAELIDAALTYERLLRRARLRATGDDWQDEGVRLHQAKCEALEAQQKALAAQVEAARTTERLQRKCRRCHPDANDELLILPAA